MITPEERDEIRADLLIELREELEEEERLRTNYDWAESEIMDERLCDIHEEILDIMSCMNKYGWDMSIQYVTDRLRDM